MSIRAYAPLAALVALLGCATPYHPSIYVDGGADFPGIAGIVEQSSGRQVDVVLVHGMCTKPLGWADNTVKKLLKSIDGALKTPADAAQTASSETSEILVVESDAQVAGGSVHFTALVWSPLTTPLKKQLDFDKTGKPTDCSAPGLCTPRRATLNGEFKDGLLNDCLADVMIYQGQSHRAIKQKMIDALTKVIERSESASRHSGTEPGPLVLVSESLGSKLLFDSLVDMRQDKPGSRQQQAAERARGRLALVFMAANQLPILGLADQNIGGSHLSAEYLQAPRVDSLQRFLSAMGAVRPKVLGFSSLTLVAFTDPNDLLSYRLRASQYEAQDVSIVDVLVSNSTTYFGLLERPDVAHLGYLGNSDVTSIIACGKPKHWRCK